MPTAPVAAASLVAGFAVADLTGVRPLGGAVLIAAAAWLFVRWRATAGTVAAVALLVVYWAAFAVSHVLGDLIGAWPSVLVVALLAGAAAWLVADRRGAGASRGDGAVAPARTG